MNEIIKLSELALYLKQSAETYSQPDYEQLHQELRARYEQQIWKHSWSAIPDGVLSKVMPLA